MLKPGTSPHGAIVRGLSSMRSRIQACEQLLGRRCLWIRAAKSPGANIRNMSTYNADMILSGLVMDAIAV